MLLLNTTIIVMGFIRPKKKERYVLLRDVKYIILLIAIGIELIDWDWGYRRKNIRPLLLAQSIQTCASDNFFTYIYLVRYTPALSIKQHICFYLVSNINVGFCR